jgi:hypothetical protein
LWLRKASGDIGCASKFQQKLSLMAAVGTMPHSLEWGADLHRAREKAVLKSSILVAKRAF